ncbi:hypothetical protein, partial [Rhodoferax antarcticus]|uniref:hypothetical protein n=1 Tax=Rhodoferax antarcticus TaxID=81479 RepID=UPI0022241704
MTSAHDMVIGLLGLQETVSGAEVELVSSGKATLRFCIGPAEVQSRVLDEAATRSNFQQLPHDLFCSLTPSIPRRDFA